MPLLYKLDARETANLWANIAKTTPASNGGPVAVWSPSAGSSITDDCTQATAANQPTLSTNYLSSGRSAVVFDGSNDRLLTIDSNAWDPTAITVVCAARAASVAGDRLFCSKWDGANWNAGWGMGFSTNRFTGAVNTWNSSGPLGTTGSQLCAVRTNGSWRDTFYNGLFWGSSGSASNPANAFQFALGAGSGGQFPAAIGIHCVLVYDTALSNAELDAALYDCDNAFGLGFYDTRTSGGSSSINSQQLVRQGWI